MYLLMNDNEKVIVETAKELESYNLDRYEVYSLALVDKTELITDSEIRDIICKILKGNQMTKSELLEKAHDYFEIPKSNVSKVITKMKKEKLIYNVKDWNYLGERFIGMD